MAIAPPTISARSVAIATSSACAHSPRTTGRGYSRRQCSGSDRPVASPSLADRYCTNIAIRFARTMTQRSRYPYCAPAEKFVAKLPGST